MVDYNLFAYEIHVDAKSLWKNTVEKLSVPIPVPVPIKAWGPVRVIDSEFGDNVTPMIMWTDENFIQFA